MWWGETEWYQPDTHDHPQLSELPVQAAEERRFEPSFEPSSSRLPVNVRLTPHLLFLCIRSNSVLRATVMYYMCVSLANLLVCHVLTDVNIAMCQCQMRGQLIEKSIRSLTSVVSEADNNKYGIKFS